MGVLFWSTGCPKCSVLKQKLDKAGIEYTVKDNVDEMLALGMKSAPCLSDDNGIVLDFKEAIKWVNSVEAQK